MIASTLLSVALIFTASVASLDVAHKGSNNRMVRHRRSGSSGATITIPGNEPASGDNGVGAKPMGWWLAGKDCQGKNASKCLANVGKNGFSNTWKGAKEPKAQKVSTSSSVKASSTTSSHVSSSSSSAHTSSHRSSSTHPSSSHSSTHSARPTSSHHSSTHSSVHHSSSHTSSSAAAAKTSASSSGSCPARKRDQLAFNANGSSRFEANALRVHNEVRKAAGVSGELTWSKDLAKTASQWANQCEWAKSSSTLGENLAAGYPNIATAIREWGSDDTTDQYAQLLDGQVSAVGCAVKTCDFSASVPDYDFGPVNFYVCAYDAITA